MSLEAWLKIRLPTFEIEVALDLPEVGYTVMLGPSGAGKSLTLKALAGLIPCEGRLKLKGEEITSHPPEKRRLVYLPQGSTLFPHLNVLENLLFPFAARGQEVDQDLLSEVIETFKLRGLLKRYPATLSGGEAQRVALARAVCASPKVLLLDEPLSSLDFYLKLELIDFLRSLPERFSLSVLQVTHDPLEAILLAQRLYLMREGKLVFKGKLEEFLHSLNGKKAEESDFLSPAFQERLKEFAKIIKG